MLYDEPENVHVFSEHKNAPLLESSKCKVQYEPCLLSMSDVAQLPDFAQRYYVYQNSDRALRSICAVSRRSCAVHVDQPCIATATMVTSRGDAHYPFSLECVLGAQYDALSGRYEMICERHKSPNCFVVQNYVFSPLSYSRIKLTVSTFSLALRELPAQTASASRIPCKPPFYDLNTALFALDHFGKTCDVAVSGQCQEIWDWFRKNNKNIDFFLSCMVTGTCIDDRVRLHRTLAKLWAHFDRTTKTCFIQNCVCHEDDDT